MNYETAIELAKQRMREIGKTPDEYHIESVSVVGTHQERADKHIIIKAYNEYYYLVNYQSCFGFVIISDTGTFNTDDFTDNNPQEFSGMIQLIQFGGTNWSISTVDPAGIEIQRPVEFIKAVIH